MNTNDRHHIPTRFALALALLVASATAAIAQGTMFTYQGRLTDTGMPVSNIYEMRFSLFDSLAGGTQQGLTITNPAVQVTNGVFTLQLDFGDQFDGYSRYLEVAVRPVGSPDPFVVLTPRQPVACSPYAIKSATAGVADTAANATQLGGMPASGFIQNSSTVQTSTNFNISGTGSANIINAASEYQIGNERVMKAEGSNLLVGKNAGPVTTGSYNSFFGYYSGNVNTTGAGNSFFGRYAGLGNTTGSYGTFVGSNSGSSNTTENNNTFIGAWSNGAAGLTNATAIGYRAAVSQSNSLVLGSINGENGATVSVNVGIGTAMPTQRLHVVGNGLFTGTLSGGIVSATTQYNLAGLRMLAASGPYNDGIDILAASNTFAGEDAGLNTTPDPTPGGYQGKFNSFFGAIAGRSNTTGSNNSFFGSLAGKSNTTGGANSFFGSDAGYSNTTGVGNSFFGRDAGNKNTVGYDNSFFGRGAGYFNTTGHDNSFFGNQAGGRNTTGIGSTFVGYVAGTTNTVENNNTIIGSNADLSAGVTNATALGHSAYVTQSNSLVLGSINGVNFATADTRVGIGTTAPQTALHVKNSSYPTILGESSSTIGTWLRLLNGSAGGRTWSIISSGSGNGEGAGKLLFFDEAANATRMLIDTNGFVTINALGSAGETALCRNGSNQISTCSSSMRYKTNVAPFNQGLNLINQLRPISFNWREGGLHDLGLSAEEVAAVEPLLVTRNDKGEVEGVKYDRIAVVLVNAIKQQQAQIESLKKLVCMDHPDADVCK